jgi:hypothetical protein
MAEPWLPFLEANQGTISVVALVLALAAFLWEFYRANTQRQRELEEEIEEAILLIEDLEQFIADPDYYYPDPDEDGPIDEIAIIATALRALAAAHVKKPTLSLPLLRTALLAESMQTLSSKELDVEAEDLWTALDYHKTSVQEALKVAKRRVVFRRSEQRKARKALSRLISERNRVAS